MKLFNPLTPFQSTMIDGLKNLHRRYLVTQTYRRGDNPLRPDQTPILLTPYENIGLAQGHLGAIFADRYKSIIDLDKPAHVSKLHEMCRPFSPYLLYIAAIIDPKAINVRKNKYLVDAVHKYIRRCTSWKIDRAESVSATLELVFGELYLAVSFKGETITEKLYVFEHLNLDACATTSPSPPISR